MLQATQQAAQDIEQNQIATMSLYDKLNIDSLPGVDRDRAKNIVATYQDKIDGLIQQMNEDPLSFRRKSGDIVSIARDIRQNWTQGEAAAISAQAQAMKEWEERQYALFKAGKITDPQSIQAMKNKMLQDFNRSGGTSFNDGKYNQLGVQDLMPSIDLQEKLYSYIKDMNPRKVVQEGESLSKDGLYIVKTKRGTETLTEGELLNVAMQSLMGDTGTLNYLAQRQSIGTGGRFFDTETGSLISPYEVIEEKDKKGNIIQRLNWKNDKTPLANLLQGVIDRKVTNNVEFSQTTKVEPYAYLNQQASINSDKKTDVAPDEVDQPVILRSAFNNTEEYNQALANLQASTAQINETFENYAKNLSSADQSKYIAALADAQAKAKLGDYTAFDNLVATYAGNNIELRRQAKVLASNNVMEDNYRTQYKVLEQLAIANDPGLVHDTKQLKAAVDNILTAKNPTTGQSLYNTSISKPIHITYGKTWDGLARVVAQKLFKGLETKFENIENWPSHVYYQDENGKITLTTPDALIEENILNVGQKVPKSDRKEQYPTTTVSIFPETGETALPTGKLKNSTGQLGMVVHPIKGTNIKGENVDLPEFSLRLPIMSTKGTPTKTAIYFHPGVLYDDDFNALRLLGAEQSVLEQSVHDASVLNSVIVNYYNALPESKKKAYEGPKSFHFKTVSTSQPTIPVNLK